MLDAGCCALLLKLNAEAAANRVAVGVGVTGEAGYMGTWEHGNMGTWEYGNMGIWEQGNLGIWEGVYL
jgi:hypothetical protein